LVLATQVGWHTFVDDAAVLMVYVCVCV